MFQGIANVSWFPTMSDSSSDWDMRELGSHPPVAHKMSLMEGLGAMLHKVKLHRLD